MDEIESQFKHMKAEAQQYIQEKSEEISERDSEKS
jgi:hypothetical protein